MSEMMKAKELASKNNEFLNGRLDELAAENMKLRFQKSAMQLNNTARIRQVRREIARIKTILNSRAGA